MKNYKMNEQLMQDVIFNGYEAVFILTDKHCKNAKYVKDEPMFEGRRIMSIPELGTKYLIAQSVKDSIYFKQGKDYVFRITYQGGKKFSLSLASKDERTVLGFDDEIERR